MKSHFTEKEIQVVNKDTQLHFVSLIRKVKVKTTMGIHVTPHSVSEEVEPAVAPAGGSVSWFGHNGNHLAAPGTGKTCSPAARATLWVHTAEKCPACAARH